jgi:hypothetical protein
MEYKRTRLFYVHTIAPRLSSCGMHAIRPSAEFSTLRWIVQVSVTSRVFTRLEQHITPRGPLILPNIHNGDWLLPEVSQWISSCKVKTNKLCVTYLGFLTPANFHA